MSQSKNILFMVLAVVVGLFVGGMVNMGILGMIPKFFPYPDGLDPNVTEDIATFIQTAPFGAFVLVWLAHWGQAFVGGIVAALIAPNGKKIMSAMIVGALTMVGGIATIFMIPSPVWHIIIDLLGYLPVAWLGGTIGKKLMPGQPAKPISEGVLDTD